MDEEDENQTLLEEGKSKETWKEESKHKHKHSHKHQKHLKHDKKDKKEKEGSKEPDVVWHQRYLLLEKDSEKVCRYYFGNLTSHRTSMLY